MKPKCVSKVIRHRVPKGTVFFPEHQCDRPPDIHLNDLQGFRQDISQTDIKGICVANIRECRPANKLVATDFECQTVAAESEVVDVTQEPLSIRAVVYDKPSVFEQSQLI